MMKRLFQWMLVGVMIVGIGMLGGRVYTKYENYGKQQETTAMYARTLSDSQAEVARLRAEKHELEKNSAYYEQLIREELGWVKNGEAIYLLDQ